MLGTKLQLEYDGILCIFQILRYHRNNRAITQEVEKWRREILLEFFPDKLQCVYIEVGCLLKDEDVNDSTKEETIELTKD